MTPPRTRFLSTVTVLATLLATPAWAGGWLGITVQTPEGVQVGEIYKEGPADKAGLQRNDVVIRIDGKGIGSMRDFLTLIANAQPGREMTLIVQRKGEEKEIKITPDDSRDHPSRSPDGHIDGAPVRTWQRSELRAGNAPPMEAMRPLADAYSASMHEPPSLEEPSAAQQPPAPPADPLEPPATVWLGIAPELAPNGVSVARVAPGGPGERAGLKIGDQIISLNGQSISSPRAMARVLRGFRPGDLIEMTIHRKGQLIDTQAQLAAPPADQP
ncbi:MAG: PDZ domain-containing protein [Magnetococcus sp. YQC-9]